MGENQDTNNFQMLRESLQDQVSYGDKELDEAKAGIAASSETKATATGDLAVTSKELAADVKTKATLHHDCMTRAEIFEAVRLIRDIAGKQKSTALTQLAAKMTTAMQGADQFTKVKGLVRDMIARLEAEQAADAAKKAWCDRNLADTRQKISEKNAEIAKQTSRIDLMTATAAQLKEDVAALQGQLAKLAQSQAKMDGLRKEQNTEYLQIRADQ